MIEDHQCIRALGEAFVLGKVNAEELLCIYCREKLFYISVNGATSRHKAVKGICCVNLSQKVSGGKLNTEILSQMILSTLEVSLKFFSLGENHFKDIQ